MDNFDGDDFSDSDSDAGSTVSVTDVSLGLSDGPVEIEDARNPLVSRIGGRPAWLPTKFTPPASVSTCAHCSKSMELLVQIFAPLEGSAYDRVLFVWGCARGSCQRKPQGSIRAVRLLQHNPRWAAKLAKQKARAEAAAEQRKAKAAATKAREVEQAARQKINPFAAAAPNAAGGLGNMLFGAPTSAPAGQATQPTEHVADEEDDDASDSDEETSRLAEELAVKASLQATERTADWASSSTYYEPALYLNTVPEPSASARRAANTKLTPAAKDAVKAAGKDGVAGTVLDDDTGLKAWAGESYTKMMVSGVDETFERFVARVEPEARQVVRYEMAGIPLPFNASGPIFEQLWPKVKPTHVQATRPGHAPTATQGGRSYDPSQVPACPACGGNRTFEVQLMPNLVNLLKPTLIKGAEEADTAAFPSTGSAEDRRRREIERALGRKLPREPDADGITRPVPQQSEAEKEEEARAMQARTGLNFATAIVFVCEKDCCLPREDGEANETWREEWVGLQWEE